MVGLIPHARAIIPQCSTNSRITFPEGEAELAFRRSGAASESSMEIARIRRTGLEKSGRRRQYECSAWLVARLLERSFQNKCRSNSQVASM